MNHRMLAAVSCACLFLGGGACAAPKLLENIPLTWSPTSTLAEMGPLDISGPLLSKKIHLDPFQDARQTPALIAENHEKESRVLPVTTSDNVGAFVTRQLGQVMQKAGLSIADGPVDVTLSGEVRDFFVTEDSTYRGSVSLLVHAKNAQGKEIWTGIVAGDARRFGRSYKAENYYEVISDMLVKAAYNLMSNPGFRQALATD
jgi:hypothetical protein